MSHNRSLLADFMKCRGALWQKLERCAVNAVERGIGEKRLMTINCAEFNEASKDKMADGTEQTVTVRGPQTWEAWLLSFMVND